MFVIGLIPVVAAALTVGGRYAWDHWHGSAPYLVCPRTLDLGERERGEIAIGRFQIQNIGRGALTANDFSTSCDSLPPEITAELHGIPDHPDQHLLNIKWHPSANRKRKQLSEVRIRLRVRSENEEMKLEVPVLLTEDRSL